MDWKGVRLHVVTGKGGTGKTTVAAALALALATEGKHVLLAEVEGRQGISQVFDVPPLGDVETPLATGLDGGKVWGLAVDPKTALLEYLQMFYRLGKAGGMLEKFGVIDFTTTIAPGIRDVLLIGKVYEAVRRREARRGVHHDQIYDAVVLDAPPTGRIGKFLGVNDALAGLAKVGPVKNQAESITALLTSPQTVVHLVTLLEEMPVQETLDAATELRSLAMPLGAVIVNGEQTPVVSDRARRLLRDPDFDTEPLRGDLGAAGLRVGPTLVDGLIQAGLDLDDRLAMQDRERSELTDLSRPILDLPLLTGGVDASGLRTLARVLQKEAAR